MTCTCLPLRSKPIKVPICASPKPVELRCATAPVSTDIRTDLFSIRQCATVACPDGSGEVTRCKAAGSYSQTLFNASPAIIAQIQAQLNAQALVEATRLAVEARGPCETSFESTKQCFGCAEAFNTETENWVSCTHLNVPENEDGVSVEDDKVCVRAGRFTSEISQQDANDQAIAYITNIFFNTYWTHGDIGCYSCDAFGTDVVKTIAEMRWHGSITGNDASEGTDETGCNGGTIQMLGGSGTFNLSSAGSPPAAVCLDSNYLCIEQAKTFILSVDVTAGGSDPDGYLVLTEPLGAPAVVDPPEGFVQFTGNGHYEISISIPQCQSFFVSFYIETSPGLQGTISFAEAP